MVLIGDETRRKEDYAPLARTIDSLLDDPHYQALYTDREWFDEFVSRSPLAMMKQDFPDWEETARGMLNHAFLAEAWGVTAEDIGLTYDGRRVPFDEAVFGRSMGTEKEFSDAMARLMKERVTPAEVGARVVRGAVEGTHDVRAGFYDMTAGLLRGERNPYVDLTSQAAGMRVPELERELAAAEQERQRAEHRGALREAVIANGRMESLRREIGIASEAAQGRVEESFWGSLSRSSEELAREAQSQGEEAHAMFPEVIDPAHDGLWIMRVADSVGQSAPGTAASILNPTFGLSLMYAQTYEGALREYRAVAVERGLDPSDEAAERYAHQQAILQTPFELLGDVAVGQVLKATLRSMPKSPVAGGAKAFGEWIGERARGIAESTAGETLFTTPAQTYGEAYLAEGKGVRERTTFGQKTLASLDAMSIALGQAGFTSGGPAVAAALVKGAKGDFTARNLEVPVQYIALNPKGEEATREAVQADADSSPESQPTEANKENTEPGEPPAPYGVSKEGAKVLAFNADPKADWERARVVRSTGKEIFGEAGIPQGSKLKGILAVIREWGERSGLFAKHQTPALGAEVQITPNAIVNDLSHWAGREKVVSVAALPELLGQAVYIQTQEISTQPGLKHHILAAKLEIDGVPHMVSIVVRESNGHLFYDHEIVEKDKGESSAATPIGTNTRGGLQNDSPSVGRVVKEALGVKPKLSGSVGEKGIEEAAANPAPGETRTPVDREPTNAESPVADQVEQGGTSLGTPPQTESKARFGEKEFYFDEDPNSLEFVRSHYEDASREVKAAVKRVDAIWEEFQQEMDKLGVEVDYSRPDELSECMVEGDKIVFYLGYDNLVRYEKNAPPEKVAPGESTRTTLGEELIHAVHLKELERDWQRSKSPDDLNTYVATRQREAFADMRKTIEGASEKDREVMLRTIKQSHDVYFCQFEKDMPESPSEKDILAFIENKGDSPTFMNEFMRQIVQLSEQGNITEGVRQFIDEAKEWVKKWLNGLYKGLPGAFRGDFGPELQAQVKQIQKGLDQIDRKVFRGRPASP